eukprot:11762417-Prorocentrum_lima.AAC.1
MNSHGAQQHFASCACFWMPLVIHKLKRACRKLAQVRAQRDQLAKLYNRLYWQHRRLLHQVDRAKAELSTASLSAFLNTGSAFTSPPFGNGSESNASDTAGTDSVSYTHLTLPTICSV